MSLPAIVQRYLDAYNHKDVAELVACVAETIVFEHVTNTGPSMKIEGRAAFAEFATQATAMFVTRRQTVRTAVVERDCVALEIDWTGVPAVDLGAMKAGAQVTMRGASFLTIADGKLVRIVDLS